MIMRSASVQDRHMTTGRINIGRGELWRQMPTKSFSQKEKRKTQKEERHDKKEKTQKTPNKGKTKIK